MENMFVIVWTTTDSIDVMCLVRSNYKPSSILLTCSGYDNFIIMNKKYQVIDIISKELNELFYLLKHTFLILSRIKYFNI
jgi:hypothetical protein